MSTEERVAELTKLMSDCGRVTVDAAWPYIDDAKLRDALAHPDLTDQMEAVAGLVCELLPMPDSPTAAAAVRASVNLGVLHRLAK